MSGHGEACPTMHGQNPSWASGEPADRTERERSSSTVMATSADIDGRADEWEGRAVCVPAKAAVREARKVKPLGRSPVCRRRYVGKECEVTGEIPECAAFAEPQKTGPIRCLAEVVLGTAGSRRGSYY